MECLKVLRRRWLKTHRNINGSLSSVTHLDIQIRDLITSSIFTDSAPADTNMRGPTVCDNETETVVKHERLSHAQKMATNNPSGLLNLPSELLITVIENILPPAGEFDHNITDFIAMANTRTATLFPHIKVASIVDDELGRWADRNGTLRLIANVNAMDFGLLVNTLTNLGPSNTARVHRLLITLRNMPSLDQTLPESFWQLVRYLYRNPASTLR